MKHENDDKTLHAIYIEAAYGGGSTLLIQEREKAGVAAVEAEIIRRQSNKPVAYYVTAERLPTIDDVNGVDAGEVFAWQDQQQRWACFLWKAVRCLPEVYTHWMPQPAAPISPDDAACNAYIATLSPDCDSYTRAQAAAAFRAALAHRDKQP